MLGTTIVGALDAARLILGEFSDTCSVHSEFSIEDGN
jgi:hypothetical protein